VNFNKNNMNKNDEYVKSCEEGSELILAKYIKYHCSSCEEGSEVIIENFLNDLNEIKIIKIIKKILKFDMENEVIFFELTDNTFGYMKFSKNEKCIDINDFIFDVCNDLMFHKKEGTLNYYTHKNTNAIYTYDKLKSKWNRIGIQK